MHFIQKYILDKLRTAPSVRYSELRPDGIESSHFRYHLKELIKANYVTQLSRGMYMLTVAGGHFVDKQSKNSVQLTAMPKVITYTALYSDKRLYLQRKTKQPYMGMMNFIGGKVHENEMTQDASVREVYEKTGLTIANPRLVGVFEIIISKDQQLSSHTIAFLFWANVEKSVASNNSLDAFLIEGPQTILDPAPDLHALLPYLASTVQPQFKSIQIKI